MSDRQSVQVRLAESPGFTATLSPDGRWLAYDSDESGQSEIYVRPFPAVDAGQWQPSGGGGGTTPVWSPATRELFYVNAAGTGLMVVPFEQETSFVAGTPRLLFEHPSLILGGSSSRTFDVSADGQRFLMLKQHATARASDSSQDELRIVLNWFEELKERAPGR